MKMMTKKRGKRYPRKNRPVTVTDKYWHQLGILEGQKLRIKEHKRGQADYKDRYYNQMRANQWLVHEMNRIDPEVSQSKKITFHRKVVERILEIIETSTDPRHERLAIYLVEKMKEA